MKLRNKKTGEIGNLVLNINPNRESYCVLSTENGNTVCGNLVLGDYDSLAELNEEWEDYEEPKYGYFINAVGGVDVNSYADDKTRDSFAIRLKQVGNYFETEEEAEKAVEKLMAWKRLKDKGFKFVGRSIKDLTITYSFDNYDEPDIPQMNADLDLLFSGGEE